MSLFLVVLDTEVLFGLPDESLVGGEVAAQEDASSFATEDGLADPFRVFASGCLTDVAGLGLHILVVCAAHFSVWITVVGGQEARMVGVHRPKKRQERLVSEDQFPPGFDGPEIS